MKAKVKIKKSPDKLLNILEKINSKMEGPTSVKVGLPKGSNNYPDGTSIIMVGAVHEFGSPVRNVPQRSYLRSTVVEKRSDYRQFIKKLAEHVVSKGMPMNKALGLLGLKVKSDVQAKIRAISKPPLKHRKGNPLVDTGHLIQSIQYKIEE